MVSLKSSGCKNKSLGRASIWLNPHATLIATERKENGGSHPFRTAIVLEVRTALFVI